MLDKFSDSIEEHRSNLGLCLETVIQEWKTLF